MFILAVAYAATLTYGGVILTTVTALGTAGLVTSLVRLTRNYLASC